MEAEVERRGVEGSALQRLPTGAASLTVTGGNVPRTTLRPGGSSGRLTTPVDGSARLRSGDVAGAGKTMRAPGESWTHGFACGVETPSRAYG